MVNCFFLVLSLCSCILLSHLLFFLIWGLFSCFWFLSLRGLFLQFLWCFVAYFEVLLVSLWEFFLNWLSRQLRVSTLSWLCICCIVPCLLFICCLFLLLSAVGVFPNWVCVGWCFLNWLSLCGLCLLSLSWLLLTLWLGWILLFPRILVLPVSWLLRVGMTLFVVLRLLAKILAFAVFACR